MELLDRGLTPRLDRDHDVIALVQRRGWGKPLHLPFAVSAEAAYDGIVRELFGAQTSPAPTSCAPLRISFARPVPPPRTMLLPRPICASAAKVAGAIPARPTERVAARTSRYPLERRSPFAEPSAAACVARRVCADYARCVGRADW